MKPPNSLDDNQKPSKKMKTITITTEMQSNDEEEPLSHYIPKSLGKV